MLFLMKLLFGFCLDFCCQKIWITQASNLEITKKNYGNMLLRLGFYVNVWCHKE